MREVDVGEIGSKISELFISACYDLGDDVLEVFKKARKNEESPIGVAVLDEIIENAKIAKEGVYPLCQDTGLAVTFLDIGQEVCLVGGNLEEANARQCLSPCRDAWHWWSRCSALAWRCPILVSCSRAPWRLP